MRAKLGIFHQSLQCHVSTSASKHAQLMTLACELGVTLKWPKMEPWQREKVENRSAVRLLNFEPHPGLCFVCETVQERSKTRFHPGPFMVLPPLAGVLAGGCLAAIGAFYMSIRLAVLEMSE